MTSPRPDVENVATSSQLAGRRVRLRPLVEDDYGFVRTLEMADGTLQTYRHRGVTAPPETFASSLWGGVCVQMLVVDSHDQPLGIAVAYNADFRHGHVRVAALYSPHARGLGWPVEGLELFVNYLFLNFDFRKLYADTLAPNSTSFSTLYESLFQVEGRLRDHEYVNGEYADMIISALYRETWAVRYHSDRQGTMLSADPTNPEEVVHAAARRVDVDLGSVPSAAPLAAVLDSLALYELIEQIEASGGLIIDESLIDRHTTLDGLIDLVSAATAHAP